MTQDDDADLRPRRAPEDEAFRLLAVPEPLPKDLDPVLHDRMRLGIVLVLAFNERASFVELRNTLGMTDGSLSVHARRLEEAGYIASEKIVEARVARTEYRLPPAGRKALQRYLHQLETLLAAARPLRAE